MKKISLLVAFALSANAGVFSMVSGMSMQEIKPQASYTVDTAGINPRVYEFDTQVKPIMHCVAFIASSHEISALSMVCVEKKK